MHCVDCHFKQDNHGNGKLYGEPRAAVEIDCVDCHGTIAGAATLDRPRARRRPGTDLTGAHARPSASRASPAAAARSPSAAWSTEGVEWEVPQVVDTRHARATRTTTRRRACAKTMQTDGTTWGDARRRRHEARPRQQQDDLLHLPLRRGRRAASAATSRMKANEKKPILHNEGGDSRNWTTYNFQTLRDDIFILAKDGTVTRQPHRARPLRLRGARLARRTRTASGSTRSSRRSRPEGFAGTAFSHLRAPHRARARRPSTCTRLPRLARPATTTPGWRSC